MIYQIKDLDTNVWEPTHFHSTEDAADAANMMVKTAVMRQTKRHLAILGGNKIYVESITTGEAWF